MTLEVYYLHIVETLTVGMYLSNRLSRSMQHLLHEFLECILLSQLHQQIGNWKQKQP